MTDEEKFLCRCACRRCTKQSEEECKTCEYNYYDKEGKRMRLIDADALIEILRNSHESHATNSREESLLDRDIRLVQEQAKYHPIIIEERPHGEWKPCTFTDKRTGETVNFTIGSVVMMTCSVCNKDAFAGGNFCPNCGASMSASDRQVTGKLNSEIEKSKSEIEKSKSEMKGGE